MARLIALFALLCVLGVGWYLGPHLESQEKGHEFGMTPGPPGSFQVVTDSEMTYVFDTRDGSWWRFSLYSQSWEERESPFSMTKAAADLREYRAKHLPGISKDERDSYGKHQVEQLQRPK